MRPLKLAALLLTWVALVLVAPRAHAQSDASAVDASSDAGSAPQESPQVDAGVGETAAPESAADAGSAPMAPDAVADGGLAPIEAEEAAPAEAEAPLQTDDVVVVGEQLKDPAESPVAAFTVSEEELKRQQPLSVNDVLQRVPGMTVRAEEGMGLRPNIGFRGLSPDRSRAVLVLEDGVPVQMMPYDYPELYVAPRIERMRSVEVVRGAGSIIYGPRTIGGVVNFVTLAPPPELKLVAEARGGTGGYYFGYASAGDTVGRVGYLVTAMHQAFDGPRQLGLQQTDLMGKVAVDLRDAGELQVKLQFYDEDSNSTTLGLTTSQYDAGKLRNYAWNDRFPVRRYAAQVTHQIDFSSKVNLATTSYFNVTTRDWWRQNYLRQSAMGASYDRIIGPQGQVYGGNSGQGTNDGSSLFFLNSNVGHLRRFIVGGVEPRLSARYSTRAMQGELITGVRLHYEHSDIRDVAGDSASARSGTDLNVQARQVMALAAYARPTFNFFHRHLEVAPGLRVESMRTHARVDRGVTTPSGIVDGSYQDATSSPYNPALTNTHTLVAFIPGLSVLGVVNDWISVYGGVHRGFVPPGVQDAIVGGAENLSMKPQYSWNYEAGVRSQPRQWLRYEATAFYLDYVQQVLDPSVVNLNPGCPSTSNCAPGSANNLASGASKSYGFEGSGGFDVASFAKLGFELPITFAYTYTQSQFGTGWGPGVQGNVVPYIPKHTLSTRLDFAHPIGIEGQFSVDHLSSRFTDPHNVIEPTLDGTAGVIGAYTVCNLRLQYKHRPWRTAFFAEARNLFDARYISSRAPDGIQPGMTRQIFGGVRFEY